MEKLEARFDFAVRRDGGPGRGLVHGTVLCALLSANHSEGKYDLGQLYSCDSAVNGNAVLRLLWSAVRSFRKEANHDVRLHSGGDFLPADLQSDASRGGLKHRHGYIATE